jgi:hypothetical protein
MPFESWAVFPHSDSITGADAWSISPTPAIILAIHCSKAGERRDGSIAS